MGHSAELVDKILKLVQREYPIDQFGFILDRGIDGTRMRPDIQVTDQSGRVCCAVEIGYTRPEKLTAYRKDLKIPDVRWYDKAGNLHGDVLEKVVKVSIENEPGGFFFGYTLFEEVLCWSDICYTAAIEESDIGLDAWNDLGTPLHPGHIDELYAYLPIGTLLVVVTDFTRVWLHFFCDKCGESRWVTKDEHCDIEMITDDLTALSGQDFARQYSARRFGAGWTEACEFVKTWTDSELCFADGEFISDREQQRFHRNVSRVRVEASAS